jgi:hypothetical protein
MLIIPATVVYADFSQTLLNVEFLAVPAMGDSETVFSTVNLTFSGTYYQLLYSLTGSAGSWIPIPLTPVVPGYMATGSFTVSDISGSQPAYMEISNGTIVLTGGTLNFSGIGTTPHDIYDSVSVAWSNSANATFVIPITSNEQGISDNVMPTPIPPSAVILCSGLVYIIGLSLWRQKRP